MKDHGTFKHRDGRVRTATTAGQAVRLAFEGWTAAEPEAAPPAPPAPPAADPGTVGQNTTQDPAGDTPAPKKPATK